MNGDEIKSIEAETPLGKFKATGSRLNDLLTTLCTLAVILLVYMVNTHTNNAKEELQKVSLNFIAVMKEQTLELRKITRLQREQNCLIAIPPDRRNPELCRRLSQ